MQQFLIKKCFDTVDKRCKHEDVEVIFISPTCCTPSQVHFFLFIPMAKFYKETYFKAAFLCINSLQLVRRHGRIQTAVLLAVSWKKLTGFDITL